MKQRGRRRLYAERARLRAWRRSRAAMWRKFFPLPIEVVFVDLDDSLGWGKGG